MKHTQNYVALGILFTSLLLSGCKPKPTTPTVTTTTAPARPNSPAAPVEQNTTPPVSPLPRLLTSEELAEGWISLFDGETLFGWTANNSANWRVEEGTIVVDEGDQGLLLTTSTFSDYVLKIDFKSATGTNSGIFLHTLPEPKDPAVDCYELNIADSDNPFPTCSLVKRAKTDGNFDSTDWQSYEVTVSNAQIIVKLDGDITLDFTDPHPLRRGHIGLQLNSGRIAFRNIKLLPLSNDSIFNGKDLTGWKPYPDMDSDFTVTEQGELNVKNGKGQLETDASYADFILQLECISNAEQLNSGIFFRCIPATS